MSPLSPLVHPADRLEAMLLIRAYELRLAALAAETGIPGTCSAVGQEAAAVGVVSALTGDDLILTNHRSAGHLLARGADPGRMMAEVMGRRDGYCKGRSGSLHISVRELGVVLTSTIVGGELSLATGVALSQTMLGRPGIVACFFGDGAACEGIFHEALNLAAVWKLPILFVCENNQWQALVHRRETMLAERISAFAAAYGVEGATVDGNDVEAVRAAALEAVADIRASGRPFLLETATYRMRGHLEPDDQHYADTGELAAWGARDPIAQLRTQLLATGALSDGEADAIDTRVAARVAAAEDFALASPWPDPAGLADDVYA
ncbi:MAG: thiamine pyrophosphate-dependent dehydrogenase E1 component subunit alpha [Thauera phenolivorans]|uniref:Thiamine pyrophosphate-dependent dehydrogenase E1 component subunit alpha n=1 Tax=Thauera phenolivorans TaxID=1792543 RepID=A0A7X7R8A3_9RHOO|nr:thiamine pyrophosphate-dependent dehydrogenase E1 component subunit alpha [Thauera phenolivorans]